MTKVRIRKVKSRSPWQFVTFNGKNGGESRGIVDLIAIRKNHDAPDHKILDRGDLFKIILIQVKGGSSRPPTEKDWERLRAVRKHMKADLVLLATWKKGTPVKFYDWQERCIDVDGIFH